VSPLNLRRFRAERLLRQEFDSLRGRVLRAVRAKLARDRASLDEADLDACYAQAWQGLYLTAMRGEEVENPAGWLVVATYRRAVEETRAWRHADRRALSLGTAWGQDAAPEGASRPGPVPEAAHEQDLASALDDRLRLRHLMEGLHGRLDGREREAAALCYLQGFSRSEAAARMGLSERRMRRLMEGRSPGRPGVAGKVGALVETIGRGAWCEAQGSLMRALAFGMLEPGGERHRLALMHRSQCPACRAYVLSLRGLAAALPPSLWPAGMGAGLLSRAHGGGHAGSAALAGKGAGGGAAGSGALGAGAGAGSAGAGAAAGASAGSAAGGMAGGAGGALLGGPLAAKLAAGCVLALGIGAGCVALGVSGHRAAPAQRRTGGAHELATLRHAARAFPSPLPSSVALTAGASAPAAPAGAKGRAALAATSEGPEFTPEQFYSTAPSGSSTARSGSAPASRASAEAGPGSARAPAASPTAPTARAARYAAEREFSPG